MRSHHWTILLALILLAPGCFTLDRIKPAVNLEIHVVEHEKKTCHLCDLFYQARAGLVRVLFPGGQAVGIVVSDTGDIVTHAHRVVAVEKIYVETHDQLHHPATVVRQDPRLDLALLRVSAPKGAVWTPMLLKGIQPPRNGDHVYAIGHPPGLGWSVTPLMVSTHCKAGEAGIAALIQTDVALSPGDTGGPLLDRLGRLVGVIASDLVAPGSENAACAIPVADVAAFLSGK